MITNSDPTRSSCAKSPKTGGISSPSRTVCSAGVRILSTASPLENCLSSPASSLWVDASAQRSPPKLPASTCKVQRCHPRRPLSLLGFTPFRRRKKAPLPTMSHSRWMIYQRKWTARRTIHCPVPRKCHSQCWSMAASAVRMTWIYSKFSARRTLQWLPRSSRAGSAPPWTRS